MDTRTIKEINKAYRTINNGIAVWENQISLAYTFYDSEIGTNGDWVKCDEGYWYLKGFENKYVFFIRRKEIYLINKYHVFNYGKDTVVDFLNYEYKGWVFNGNYSPQFLDQPASRWLIDKKINDSTYKTYVFAKNKPNYDKKLHDAIIKFIDRL